MSFVHIEKKYFRFPMKCVLDAFKILARVIETLRELELYYSNTIMFFQ